MIREPGEGYLPVAAGLAAVYGRTGEVVVEGAPPGLAGGADPQAGGFVAAADRGGAVRETETLYIQLRRGAAPEDPAPRFAELRD